MLLAFALVLAAGAHADASPAPPRALLAHVALHPPEAGFFAECPDVPALLGAYSEAPMARMFADPEALQALRGMLRRPELDAQELLKAGMAALPLPPQAHAQPLGGLTELAAISVSLSFDASEDPGLLVVADWISAAAAEGAERALGSGEGVPMRLALSRSEKRLIAGRADLVASAAKGSPGASDSAWMSHAEQLGASSGPIVLQGFQRPGANPAALVTLAPTRARPALRALVKALFPPGGMHWRTTLTSGRFVSEAFLPGATRPLPAIQRLAPAPLSTELLAEVHPGCLFVAAASFERDGLGAWLAKATGSTERAAAFEQALGASFVLFAQPLRGPSAPRTFLLVELADPDEALQSLLDFAAECEASGSELAKASKYKDVPYVAFSMPEEVASLGDLGKLRPVVAVLDGALVVTDGALSLKKEIRRRLGDPEEALPPAAYPWSGERFALPEGTGLVVFVDWAAQVDGLFRLARAFAPMLEQFSAELPVDLANLPSPLVFTRHMPPTLHVARPVEGGYALRHEAGFSFETWLGAAGGVHELLGARAAALSAEPAEEPAQKPRDPRQETLSTLRELRTALTVYKIDRGGFPESLAPLVEPAPNYPMGYLGGLTALPADGWGQPVRYQRRAADYRLWSAGADGVDQDGGGDDVAGP
jgi:hypothetical protein